MIQNRGGLSDKDFSSVKTYINKISSPLLDNIQIAREAPRYLYAASG